MRNSNLDANLRILLMAEKDEQCEKYRKFVKEKLEADYDEVIKGINYIVDEVREYETLLLYINKIKVLNPDEPLKTQMNIGKDIFCEAVIDKHDHVIVKLIDDLYAELTLQRAEEFITKKIELLNERAAYYEREAHSIRARIHVILSSVKQLENL